MTKYILHGGRTSDKNPGNECFFREITSELKGDIKILLNYFTRGKNDWEKLAKQDKTNFLQQSEQNDIKFTIARKKNFVKEIKNSHVLYFRGGNPFLLLEKLKQISNLENYFQNRVIAGSSAGAHILSRYFYSKVKHRVGKGLGILNIKICCHHSSKSVNIIRKLKRYKEDLPILALPEYKTVVLYK